MDQNIVILKVLFNVRMSFIKMRVDILILKVEKIDPFVMLNIQILYLLLHIKFSECCGVQYG